MSPPELLVPTAGLAPLTPRCPAMPVPPRPWLMTTVSCHSDGRGIRIFTPFVLCFRVRSDPRHRRRLRRLPRSKRLRNRLRRSAAVVFLPRRVTRVLGLGLRPHLPKVPVPTRLGGPSESKTENLRLGTCPVPLIAVRATRLQCPQRRRPIPPEWPVRHFNPGMSSWLFAI